MNHLNSRVRGWVQDLLLEPTLSFLYHFPQDALNGELRGEVLGPPHPLGGGPDSPPPTVPREPFVGVVAGFYV